MVDILESNPTSISLEIFGIDGGLQSAFNNEINWSLAGAFKAYLA